MLKSWTFRWPIKSSHHNWKSGKLTASNVFLAEFPIRIVLIHNLMAPFNEWPYEVFYWIERICDVKYVLSWMGAFYVFARDYYNIVFGLLMRFSISVIKIRMFLRPKCDTNQHIPHKSCCCRVNSLVVAKTDIFGSKDLITLAYI